MTNQAKQDDHPYAPHDEPGQEKAQPAGDGVKPPPKNEAPSISQCKQGVCKKLTQLFTSELMNERLMRMAGGDASRVAKNLTAFLSVITQDEGSGKSPTKYYFECSISSLTMCFLESMNMQLPFDSRKLVSMIIYDYEAELDISYKGFVNALSRHFRNAFVECKLVFEKDEFAAAINGRNATYHFKPADPFAVVTKTFDGIRGGFCYFSYTDTDEQPTSRLVFLSKEQILKNRSRARQHYVWDSDPKAMAEKTCIREGARLPFAAIDLDVDVEEVANKHFKLENSGQSRLSALMDAHKETRDDDKPKPDQGNSGGGVAQGSAPKETEISMPIGESGDKAGVATAAVDGLAEEPAKADGVRDNPQASAGVTDAEFTEHSPHHSDEDGYPAWVLHTGSGRIQRKDFVDASAASVYLKKVVSTRKSKKSRKEIIELNAENLGRMMKEGLTNIVLEMQTLSDKGED